MLSTSDTNAEPSLGVSGTCATLLGRDLFTALPIFNDIYPPRVQNIL